MSEDLKEGSCSAVSQKLRLSNGDAAGIAICTDDTVSTYTVSLVSREELNRRKDKDFIFCPTDWPVHDITDEELAVSELLRKKSALTTDFQLHQDESFEALVASLVEIRNRGQVSADCFLTVLSTDPDQYLEELENNAVERLNDETLIAKRQKFLARWK